VEVVIEPASVGDAIEFGAVGRIDLEAVQGNVRGIEARQRGRLARRARRRR